MDSISSEYWNRFKGLPLRVETNVDWDSVSTGESDPQNWSEFIEEKPARKRSISVSFQPLQHEIINKLQKPSTLMQKPLTLIQKPSTLVKNFVSSHANVGK
jgi:hypothetical protein